MSNANFKVGDKVVIKKDIIIDKRYDTETFVSGMAKYIGQTLTINKICYGNYKLLEDGNMWFWTDEMFDKVDQEQKFKVGDKVVGTSIDKKRSWVGKITRIEKNEVYCYWSCDVVEVLPKTIKEFNSIKKDTIELNIYTDDCKILNLIDDIEEPVEGNKYNFKIGDRVRVKSDVDKPYYGWGGIEKSDIGTVSGFSDYVVDKMYVDFPMCDCWSAKSDEMELADDVEPAKKIEEEVIEKDNTYKIGEEITKDQAIYIIENSGKVTRENFVYYKNILGELVFNTKSDETGTIMNSGGYANLDGYKLTVKELSNLSEDISLYKCSNAQLLAEMTRRFGK